MDGRTYQVTAQVRDHTNYVLQLLCSYLIVPVALPEIEITNKDFRTCKKLFEIDTNYFIHSSIITVFYLLLLLLILTLLITINCYYCHLSLRPLIMITTYYHILFIIITVIFTLTIITTVKVYNSGI